MFSPLAKLTDSTNVDTKELHDGFDDDDSNLAAKASIEDDMQQGCREKTIFFLKHSYRDVKRHPCHFCIAFSSVFIVVLAALVVQTIIDQGTIIFLSIA